MTKPHSRADKRWKELLKGVHKKQTCGGGKKAIRVCLSCGEEFVSLGSGNRICSGCSSKSVRAEGCRRVR